MTAPQVTRTETGIGITIQAEGFIPLDDFDGVADKVITALFDHQKAQFLKHPQPLTLSYGNYSTNRYSCPITGDPVAWGGLEITLDNGTAVGKPVSLELVQIVDPQLYEAYTELKPYIDRYMPASYEYQQQQMNRVQSLDRDVMAWSDEILEKKLYRTMPVAELVAKYRLHENEGMNVVDVRFFGQPARITFDQAFHDTFLAPTPAGQGGEMSVEEATTLLAKIGIKLEFLPYTDDDIVFEGTVSAQPTRGGIRFTMMNDDQPPYFPTDDDMPPAGEL